MNEITPTLTDSRKKYGPTLGSKAFYTYEKLVKEYKLEDLQQLSAEQVFSKANNSPVYIRAFELAGIDMTHAWDAYNQYKEFTTRFGKKFGRHNLRRNYDRYAKPLFDQISAKSIIEHNVSIQQFNTALAVIKCSVETFHKKVIWQILQAYEAAPELLELVHPDHKEEATVYNEFYEVYKLDKPEYVYSLKEFRLLIDKAAEINNGIDASNMSSQQGIAFCKYLDGRNEVCIAKLDVLNVLGFRHGNDVLMEQARLAHTKNLLQVYNEQAEFKLKMAVFNNIISVIGDIENIGNLSVDQIVSSIQRCQHHKPCFMVVKFWLCDVEKKLELFNAVENKLSVTTKGTTRIQQCLQKSEWRLQFGKELLTEYKECGKETSAYQDNRMKKIELNVATCLDFLDFWVENNFQEQLANQKSNYDIIRWFIHTTTIESVFNACVAYAKSINVDNDRVRCTTQEHHAKRQLSFMLGMLKKQAFRTRLACGHEIDSIKPNQVLKFVENKRVPADSNKRRYLNPEQVEAILNLVVDDPFLNLLLTLLVEVALRIGALRSLRYHHLLDKFHTPKSKAIVVEKGNRPREFLIGPNLKRVIASYAHFYRSEDFNVYIFGKPEDRHTCVSEGWIRIQLQKLAEEAGITDVQVYPHMFRHTLVSRLLDNGNSGEVICKYIGHASVDTTMKHYWATTPSDLMEKVVDETLNVKVTEDEIIEYKDEEIENLRDKFKCATALLDVYEKAMNKFEHEVAVQNMMGYIAQIMPEADDFRKAIKSTVNGSTVNGSTVSGSTVSGSISTRSGTSSTCAF